MPRTIRYRLLYICRSFSVVFVAKGVTIVSEDFIYELKNESRIYYVNATQAKRSPLVNYSTLEFQLEFC